MKSAGPNEKQKGKTKERQFSEREQNKNSLKTTGGLRSTVWAIFIACEKILMGLW